MQDGCISMIMRVEVEQDLSNLKQIRWVDSRND